MSRDRVVITRDDKKLNIFAGSQYDKYLVDGYSWEYQGKSYYLAVRACTVTGNIGSHYWKNELIGFSV